MIPALQTALQEAADKHSRELAAARAEAGRAVPSAGDSGVTRLRDELARTPAEVVVANHAFGLFELAALHLSLQPPQLPQARLAIDALAALAVSAVILWVGSQLGRRTVDALLDAAPEGLQQEIARAIARMDGVLDVDRIRAEMSEKWLARFARPPKKITQVRVKARIGALADVA